MVRRRPEVARGRRRSRRSPSSGFPTSLIGASPRRWWLIVGLLTLPFALFGGDDQAGLDRPALQRLRPDEGPGPRAQDPRPGRPGGDRRRPGLSRSTRAATRRRSTPTSPASSARSGSSSGTPCSPGSTTDEVLAVMGHEMGHYVLNHVAWGVTLATLGSASSSSSSSTGRAGRWSRRLRPAVRVRPARGRGLGPAVRAPARRCSTSLGVADPARGEPVRWSTRPTGSRWRSPGRTTRPRRPSPSSSARTSRTPALAALGPLAVVAPADRRSDRLLQRLSSLDRGDARRTSRGSPPADGPATP